MAYVDVSLAHPRARIRMRCKLLAGLLTGVQFHDVLPSYWVGRVVVVEL